MVFAHPEEIDTIVSHTRDIPFRKIVTSWVMILPHALRRRRRRLKRHTDQLHRHLHREKLDSRAVDGIDPKTGKPRVDHKPENQWPRAWNAPSAGRAFTGPPVPVLWHPLPPGMA